MTRGRVVACELTQRITHSAVLNGGRLFHVVQVAGIWRLGQSVFGWLKTELGTLSAVKNVSLVSNDRLGKVGVAFFHGILPSAEGFFLSALEGDLGLQELHHGLGICRLRNRDSRGDRLPYRRRWIGEGVFGSRRGWLDL